MELVTNEMDWTVNCFQYHERIWEGRADRADGLCLEAEFNLGELGKNSKGHI